MISQFQLVIMTLSAVWILIFFTKPEVRKEMIILGAFVGLLFGTSFLEVVFSFVLAGISATIFHALLGKHYHALPKLQRKHWVLEMIIAITLLIWGTLFLIFAFDVSFEISFLLASLVLALYMVLHRRDLLADSIFSGLLTATIVYLAVTFSRFMIDTDYSIISNIFLISLASGMAFGPIYEFFRRYKIK